MRAEVHPAAREPAPDPLLPHIKPCCGTCDIGYRLNREGTLIFCRDFERGYRADDKCPWWKLDREIAATEMEDRDGVE